MNLDAQGKDCEEDEADGDRFDSFAQYTGSVPGMDLPIRWKPPPTSPRSGQDSFCALKAPPSGQLTQSSAFPPSPKT